MYDILWNNLTFEICHFTTEKIELEEYFFEVLPNYDEDRVYASDIKKIIQWYNILLDNDITDFVEDEKDAEEPTVSASEEEE